MNELYEVKEKLLDELERYHNKEVTNSNVTMIDTLAHAIKNIEKIIKAEGVDYSNDYMTGGHSYRGRSYGRRRDSMGRYSSAADEVIMDLHKMIDDAPDERTRSDYQRILHKIEKM